MYLLFLYLQEVRVVIMDIQVNEVCTKSLEPKIVLHRDYCYTCGEYLTSDSFASHQHSSGDEVTQYISALSQRIKSEPVEPPDVVFVEVEEKTTGKKLKREKE